MTHGFAHQRRLDLKSWAAEAHRFLSDPLLNDFIQSDTGAPANKQDFLGIYLDVFLVRVLATSLRRYVAGTALENLQQCLLHAFSGNVSRDGNVISFSTDFVDFVNIDDADLGPFHIVIGVLQ